jgi:SAM-dependent methyltransferase
MNVNLQSMIAAQEPVRTTPAVFAGYRPEFSDVEPAQWVTWKLGDTEDTGTTFRVVGERLCGALELSTGERVLNVTAGNIVSGLPDDENLPFRDSAFDVVLSGFAAMFTPDHRRIARELLRVCRRGGCIGLASWTPQGFNGRLAAIVDRYVAARPERANTELWASKEYLNGLFGHHADALGAAAHTHTWLYPSPQDWLNAWKSYGGPLHEIYQAVDPDWRDQLSSELLELVETFNEAGDGSMVVHSEYLEFLVHKSSWRS